MSKWRSVNVSTERVAVRLLSCQREGVVWMELKLREGRKVVIGVLYANSEGVRTEDTEDRSV